MLSPENHLLSSADSKCKHVDFQASVQGKKESNRPPGSWLASSLQTLFQQPVRDIEVETNHTEGAMSKRGRIRRGGNGQEEEREAPAARRTNFLSPSSLNNKRTWFQKNSGQLFIIISLSLVLPLSVACAGSFYSLPFFLVHEAWLLHFLSATTTRKYVNINKKSESCTASLFLFTDSSERVANIISCYLIISCSFPPLRRRHSAAVMDLSGGMLQSPERMYAKYIPAGSRDRRFESAPPFE